MCTQIGSSSTTTIITSTTTEEEEEVQITKREELPITKALLKQQEIQTTRTQLAQSQQTTKEAEAQFMQTGSQLGLSEEEKTALLEEAKRSVNSGHATALNREERIRQIAQHSADSVQKLQQTHEKIQSLEEQTRAKIEEIKDKLEKLWSKLRQNLLDFAIKYEEMQRLQRTLVSLEKDPGLKITPDNPRQPESGGCC